MACRSFTLSRVAHRFWSEMIEFGLCFAQPRRPAIFAARKSRRISADSAQTRVTAIDCMDGVCTLQPMANVARHSFAFPGAVFY